MKTIKFATLFLSLSMILTANAVLAKSEKEHEKNVKSTMFQFMILGLTGSALQKGANALGLEASSKAVMHLSNVMFQGGIISARPALTDLGVRALLASSAASMANHNFAKSAVANLPFIGQHLKDAGPKGVAITTVAFYEMLKMGYIRGVDSMPDSVQNMIRGE